MRSPLLSLVSSLCSWAAVDFIQGGLSHCGRDSITYAAAPVCIGYSYFTRGFGEWNCKENRELLKSMICVKDHNTVAHHFVTLLLRKLRKLTKLGVRYRWLMPAKTFSPCISSMGFCHKPRLVWPSKMFNGAIRTFHARWHPIVQKRGRCHLKNLSMSREHAVFGGRQEAKVLEVWCRMSMVSGW